VLVTAPDNPLGERVTARLARSPGVELVERLDTWEHRPLVDLLAARRIDTVIHLGLLGPSRHAGQTAPAAPARRGPTPASGPIDGTDARVIRTMRLAAAVGRRDGPVRTLVVASSASVYPISSRAPLWHREHEVLRPGPDSEAAALVEAEDYVRDVASANPHIAVAILRFADLVGPAANSPLASLLGLPFVPVAAGFDPAVQFLHVDDAADAVRHAAGLELSGLYNVAAEGTIRWRGAIGIAGRRPWPVPPVLLGPLSPVLSFGRCIDARRLAGTGFTSAFGVRQCVHVAGTGSPPRTRPRPLARRSAFGVGR
jgi:UDP-glucose 4-epimerase